MPDFFIFAWLWMIWLGPLKKLSSMAASNAAKYGMSIKANLITWFMLKILLGTLLNYTHAALLKFMEINNKKPGAFKRPGFLIDVAASAFLTPIALFSGALCRFSPSQRAMRKLFPTHA